MNILAIDPGNVASGWCIVDCESLKPLYFGKTENSLFLEVVMNNPSLIYPFDTVVIERVASYGMAVGKDVFLTCEWIGRFTQCAEYRGLPCAFLYRQEEKLHICGDSRAKDTNIRRALIDRFAAHDFKNGKGTKRKPDFFYGFRADVWQSYAVALTYIERDRPD